MEEIINWSFSEHLELTEVKESLTPFVLFKSLDSAQINFSFASSEGTGESAGGNKGENKDL